MVSSPLQFAQRQQQQQGATEAGCQGTPLDSECNACPFHDPEMGSAPDKAGGPGLLGHNFHRQTTPNWCMPLTCMINCLCAGPRMHHCKASENAERRCRACDHALIGLQLVLPTHKAITSICLAGMHGPCTFSTWLLSATTCTCASPRPWAWVPTSYGARVSCLIVACASGSSPACACSSMPSAHACGHAPTPGICKFACRHARVCSAEEPLVCWPC